MCGSPTRRSPLARLGRITACFVQFAQAALRDGQVEGRGEVAHELSHPGDAFEYTAVRLSRCAELRERLARAFLGKRDFAQRRASCGPVRQPLRARRGARPLADQSPDPGRVHA